MHADAPDNEPTPTEIRLNKAKDELTVSFDSGESYPLSAEILRVNSPSAEVQGHSPAERQTVWGKRDVRIVRLEPVGNYAVRILFSDGHDTGIYSWGYLHHLGKSREVIWNAYLEELAQKGLSRG